MIFNLSLYYMLFITAYVVELGFTTDTNKFFFSSFHILQNVPIPKKEDNTKYEMNYGVFI